MKKTLSYMSMLALFVAGCLTLACTELTDERDVVVRNADGSITYILSVDRDAGTKALAEDGNNLKKTFAEGDRIAVVYTVGSTTKVATSEALASNKIKKDGKYAEFSVTLEDRPNSNSTVKYIYPASLAKADGTVNYAALATQDGTLASLANNLDLGYKEITLIGTTFPTGVKLDNPLTIVKFTLKKASGSSISAYEFCVSDGTNEYWASVYGYDGNPTNEFYMAIPSISAGNVTLKANAYPSGYIYEKSSVTFAAGKYYEIDVKMAYYLDWCGSAITLENGDILTGSEETKVSIADGATVTLIDASVDGSNQSTKKYAGINCLGDATIILSGTNTVTGFYENYPGIHVPSGKTLTIQGTGSLNASSNGYAAGIGGGHEIDCGNITINSGTVTATGGTRSAGIGSGYNASCGDIILGGGTISATCGSYGKASIGKGSSNSTCGDITINGTHSVTLNNPNNSGSSVSSRTFMDTGNTIYLAQMVWSSDSYWEIFVGEPYLLEDFTLQVQLGCLTAQQFVYRPTN